MNVQRTEPRASWRVYRDVNQKPEFSGKWLLVAVASTCRYLQEQGHQAEATAIQVAPQGAALAVSTFRKLDGICWQVRQLYRDTGVPGRFLVQARGARGSVHVVIAETDYRDFAILYLEWAKQRSMKLYARSLPVGDSVLSGFEQRVRGANLTEDQTLFFPTYGFCEAADQFHILDGEWQPVAGQGPRGSPSPAEALCVQNRGAEAAQPKEKSAVEDAATLAKEPRPDPGSVSPSLPSSPKLPLHSGVLSAGGSLKISCGNQLLSVSLAGKGVALCNFLRIFKNCIPRDLRLGKNLESTFPRPLFLSLDSAGLLGSADPEPHLDIVATEPEPQGTGDQKLGDSQEGPFTALDVVLGLPWVPNRELGGWDTLGTPGQGLGSAETQVPARDPRG
ncbi:complement component C8 gamma chain isoform X2 [Cavia porcellus]|uniref:complement component C8 gamma chain isoform X2 n=1 Tax=Cavia porcellus TaxID=10141 RepID=UPI002FE29E96